MSDSKPSFTPGPWRVGTNNSVVCDGGSGSYDDHESCVYYGGAMVASFVRTPENARLLAAAPDLLKACRAALNDIQQWPSIECQAITTIDLLNEAINKAIQPPEPTPIETHVREMHKHD